MKAWLAPSPFVQNPRSSLRKEGLLRLEGEGHLFFGEPELACGELGKLERMRGIEFFVLPREPLDVANPRLELIPSWPEIPHQNNGHSNSLLHVSCLLSFPASQARV